MDWGAGRCSGRTRWLLSSPLMLVLLTIFTLSSGTYVGPLGSTMPLLQTRRFVFSNSSLLATATFLVSVNSLADTLHLYIQRSNTTSNVSFTVSNTSCPSWSANPEAESTCTSGISCASFPLASTATDLFLPNAKLASLRWSALVPTSVPIPFGGTCGASLLSFTIAIDVIMASSATYGYAFLSPTAISDATYEINTTLLGGGVPIYLLDSRFIVLTSVSSPVQVQMYIWQLATDLETKTPRLLAMPNITSAACFIQDVTSFRASHLAADSGASFANLYNIVCPVPAAATVELMQQGCQNDPACLGYFSKVNATTSLETALCALYQGKSTTDTYIHENRIVYLKSSTSERTCTFLMNASGSGTVYISQTGFVAGTVQIFEHTTLLATCGTGSSFQGTAVGQAGHCSDYFACYSGRLYLDSVIRVVFDSNVQSNGCNEDAAVLISLTNIDDVSVLRNSTNYVLPSSLNDTVVARDFKSSVSVATAYANTISLFVQNVRRVILNVNQTGYYCPAAAFCSTESWMVALYKGDDYGTAAPALQSCGGSELFLASEGQSGLCSTQYYCGTPSQLVGSRALNFTGWITVSIGDLSTIISDPSSACSYFAADLRTSAYFEETEGASGMHAGALSGFTLRPSSGTAFRILLLLTANASNPPPLTADAAAMIGAATTNLARVEGLDGVFINEARVVFLVLNSTAIASSSMPNTTSIGIVMDFFGDSASGSTSTPVPAGSNFVRIKIAQTHFTEVGAAVDVAFIGPNGRTVVRSVSCGTASGFWRGLDPLAYQCFTFLDCFAGYLYADDSLAATSPITAISVTLSQASHTIYPCAHTLGAIIEFDWFDTPSPTANGASCGFFCSVDRTCVDLSRVCDSLKDCSDGADESSCLSFIQVEWGYLYSTAAAPIYNSTANYTVTNYLECLKIAVANGSTAFAISSNETLCIVYRKSAAVTFIAQATRSVVAAAGFNVFAVASESTYSHCSSGLTCNNNGALKETLLPDNVTIQCQCACFSGYSGSSCNTHIAMNTIGPIIVQYRRSVTTFTEANPVYIEDALASLVTGSVSLSCSSFYQLNNLTTTYCSVVSGAQVDLAELYAAVTVPTIRGTMKQLLGTNDVAGVSLSTAPYLYTINCDSLYGDASCSLDGTGVAYIMIRGVLKTGISAIFVNVTSINSLIGTTMTTSYSCLLGENLVTTWKKNGCVRSQCAIALNGQLVTNVSVHVPGISAQVAIADSACFQQVDVQTVASVTAPTVETQVTVQNSAGDFSAFLISGICVAIAGAAVLAGAILATRIDRKNVAEAVEASRRHCRGGSISPTFSDFDQQQQQQSNLKNLLLATFSRMNLYSNADKNASQVKSFARSLFVVAVYVVIAAVFLLIFFKTSLSYDSNVQLVFERHRDAQCASSPFAAMPIAIGRLSSTTGRSCNILEVYGTASISVYAAGYCENIMLGGQQKVMVYVQSGRSLYDCQKSKLVPYMSGDCFPTTTVFNLDIPDTSYVTISCGLISQVNLRFAALTSNLTSGTTTVGTVLPTPLPSALRQHWDDPSLVGGGAYMYKRVQYSAVENTSSKNVCRFDSFASLGHAGNNASLNLLVQVPVESLMTSSAPYSLPITDQLERQYLRNNFSVPSSIAVLGPSDGDYPAGFTYNDFNESTSVSGSAAGVSSAKYYGIRGSYADIGRYFNKDALKTDGDGFTISLFLRATQDTRGFAFAVADALEDISSSSSPIVDAMQDIISNGSPDSTWFAFVYSLYSGLYVDGGEKILRFVYGNAPFDATGVAQAGSSDSARVIDLEWNLEQLNMMRLLNGAWHDVQIIFKAENSQTKAQLVVDGQTSPYSSMWNRCVQRRPIPIAQLSTSTRVPVTAALSQRVYPGGVLYTGYFNGGVAHLEFAPVVRSLFDIWRRSTPVVRTLNPYNADENIVLGALLLAAGFAFIVSLIFTSGRELLDNRRESAANDELIGFHLYCRLWKAQPKDERGRRFSPMKACHARRLLRVAAEQFVIFLEQLRDNFPHPEQELVRLMYVLYLARMNAAPIDLSQHLPTAEQWELVLVDFAEGIRKQESLLSNLSNIVSMYDDDDPADIAALVGEGTAATNSNKPDQAAQGDHMMTLDHERKRQGAIVINTDNLVFGGTTQMASQGANTSAATGLASDIKQILLPILTAIQSVYVWMSTIVLPQSYIDSFRDAFSFLFIDWSAALPNLPAIATPLLHFFAGVALCGCLFYLTHHDELAFAWHLGRYTLRRDELESEAAAATTDGSSKAIGAHAFASEVVAGIANPFGAEVECERTFNVPLLGLDESRRIEVFLGRMKATRHDQEAIAVGGELTIVDLSDRAFTLTRDETVLEKRDDLALVMPVRVTSTDATAGVLELVGVRCIIHRHHRLSSQNQTDVWPFKNRPTCCMVVNGERCDCSTGVMYHCGHAEVNERLEKSSCSYAVCDKHFHSTVVEQLIADLLALVRSVEQNGLPWFFATLFLFAANALYTPIIKTALMIIGCHPYYQCTFSCWSTADQQFICAAYLSIVIMLFYGLGYPVGLTFLLQRRSQMIDDVFFAAEYAGRYGSSSGSVNLSEWNRFAATDPTALATLYNTFELRWLYVPPILLAWKVVLLLPPVYIESGSFMQSVGVAVVEFLYGVFIFWTEPAISPLVDAMYKIGAAHQMIFLGLQSLNVYFTYQNNGTDLTNGMVATTACYLAFCLACVGYAKIAPAVKAAVHQMRITSLLSDLGMQYSAAVGLFIVPSKDPLFDIAALPPARGGFRRPTVFREAASSVALKANEWTGTAARSPRLVEEPTMILASTVNTLSSTAVVAFSPDGTVRLAADDSCVHVETRE